MKENYLDSCEFLSYYKQRFRLDSGFSYTHYTCKITGTKCVGSKNTPMKFWKMKDDLNAEVIEECSLRKKMSLKANETPKLSLNAILDKIDVGKQKDHKK